MIREPHRCADPDCTFCEGRAEERKADRRGDLLSQREQDALSDRAADRYEREVLGL